MFTTAIVTGRSKEKVYNFVGLDDVFYAGSHGLEIQGPLDRPVTCQVKLRSASLFFFFLLFVLCFQSMVRIRIKVGLPDAGKHAGRAGVRQVLLPFRLSPDSGNDGSTYPRSAVWREGTASIYVFICGR